MKEKKISRLKELDRSDFELVKEEPDIRGWDVRNRDGYKLGSVEELIIDTEIKKVRYMVVDLDENELKLSHRKILIPIGLAELHETDDDVLIPSLTLDNLALLSDYDSKNLTPETERNIAFALGRPRTSEISSDDYSERRTRNVDSGRKEQNIREKDTAVVEEEEEEDIDPDFYKHKQYDLDNLYKNRLHEAQEKKDKDKDEYSLQLWELRSKGGIVEEERREIIRKRRDDYKQRRYK